MHDMFSVSELSSTLKGVDVHDFTTHSNFQEDEQSVSVL